MGFVPLLIDVSDEPCVVLGASGSAPRRVLSLQRAGARVTVIGEQVAAEIANSAAQGEIKLIARRYESGDLEAARIVYCYDDSDNVAEAAAIEADSRMIPFNAADRPDLCSFIAPAVVDRGPLKIAVSTGGASPALARLIREELEVYFSAEYADFVQLAAAARSYLRSRISDREQRMEIAKSGTAELYQAFKRRSLSEMKGIIERRFGISMAELGFGRFAFDPIEPGSRSE
jgi:siroheme synthase-like protein